MKKKIILFLSAVSPLPLFASADFNLAGSQFKDVVTYIISLITPLTYIMDGLAFIVFFYGLTKFVIRADNKEELQKGKQYMIWGIVALFVLISFSTIIGLLSNEFGFGKATAVPALPTEQNSSTFTPINN